MRKAIMMVSLCFTLLAISSFQTPLKSEDCPWNHSVSKSCAPTPEEYQTETGCEARTTQAKCNKQVTLVYHNGHCDRYDELLGPTKCVTSSDPAFQICSIELPCKWNGADGKCVLEPGQAINANWNIYISVTVTCYTAE
jgi:hypothetical protein